MVFLEKKNLLENTYILITGDHGEEFNETKNNKIKVHESQDFPISIGLFYTAFTQFLGFPYYGDEYKVMGLTAYGKYDRELELLFNDVGILIL